MYIMSASKVQPKIQSLEEIFAESEEFARKVSEYRKAAGLPKINSVELQNKYADEPISQDIKDRNKERFARWAAHKINSK